MALVLSCVFACAGAGADAVAGCAGRTVAAGCPAAVVVLGCVVTAADLTLESRDLLCLTDKMARLKQVKKKITDNMVVERVRNALVLVPKIDSTPAKLSTNPLPLPL